MQKRKSVTDIARATGDRYGSVTIAGRSSLLFLPKGGAIFHKKDQSQGKVVSKTTLSAKTPSSAGRKWTGASLRSARGGESASLTRGQRVGAEIGRGYQFLKKAGTRAMRVGEHAIETGSGVGEQYLTTQADVYTARQMERHPAMRELHPQPIQYQPQVHGYVYQPPTAQQVAMVPPTISGEVSRARIPYGSNIGSLPRAMGCRNCHQIFGAGAPTFQKWGKYFCPSCGASLN